MTTKKDQTNKKVSSHKSSYCKICDKKVMGGSYKYKCHLYRHNAIQARYECMQCPKKFFRKDNYNMHLKTHKVIHIRKTYTCDYCRKVFINRTNLILHLNKHESIESGKFKCEACGVCYSENRLLKHHIRQIHFNLNRKEPMHVKKKLNETWVEQVMDTEVCVLMTKVNNNVISIKKCDKIKECNKKDSQNNKASQLTNDYINTVGANTYYSKAICDYCKKEMWKKSISSHIREKHLKIRKFQCNSCQRQFNRRYQMKNHICGKVLRRRVKNSK